jgi:hypothetical protein
MACQSVFFAESPEVSSSWNTAREPFGLAAPPSSPGRLSFSSSAVLCRLLTRRGTARSFRESLASRFAVPLLERLVGSLKGR